MEHRQKTQDVARSAGGIHSELKEGMHEADLSSKDVLAQEIAQQWAQIDYQEKQAWQYKAEQLKEAGGESAVTMPQVSEAIEDLDEPRIGDLRNDQLARPLLRISRQQRQSKAKRLTEWN